MGGLIGGHIIIIIIMVVESTGPAEDGNDCVNQYEKCNVFHSFRIVTIVRPLLLMGNPNWPVGEEVRELK